MGPFRELDEESQARVHSEIEAGVRARYIPALRIFRALGRELTLPMVAAALGPGGNYPMQPFIDEVIHKASPEILDFIAKSGRVEQVNGTMIPGRIRAMLTSRHLALREAGGKWLDSWRERVEAGEGPGWYGKSHGFPLAWQSDAFLAACSIANSDAESTPPGLDRLARQWREYERDWLEWVLLDRALMGKGWALEALPWVAGELAREVLGIQPGAIPPGEPELRELLRASSGHLLDSQDLERLARGNNLERSLLQSRASGSLDDFYQAVADQLHVGLELIGSSFRDYVETTLDVKSVAGPLEIVGIGVALGTPMELERVLGNNSLGQRSVPAIRIGGDSHADFWLPILGRSALIKTFDRTDLEKQAAGYLADPSHYPDPAAAFIEWFTGIGSGSGFPPEGLIRMQIALRGRTPSEPLMREMLYRYSKLGHIDVSDWPYYAPDFVRRLAPDPFEAGLTAMLQATTPKKAEAILRRTLKDANSAPGIE